MSWRVECADAVEAMRGMDEASVDAIVTDPPYGLEFMGREWDRLTYAASNPKFGTSDAAIKARGEGWQPGSAYGGRKKVPRCRRCGKPALGHEKPGKGGMRCKCPNPDFDYRHDETGFQVQAWHQAWATEALRVLKPGGHLLAFGGTRTYHRLACAIEDAGFEIRDCIAWLYGSGFPKSLNAGMAMQKAVDGHPQGRADPTSPNTGRYRSQGREGKRNEGDRGQGYGAGPGQFMAEAGERGARAITDPEAQRWQGWGTALKPSHEPIVLARKPLIGTVAQNCLEHGTGALNVDGCRVATDWDTDPTKRGWQGRTSESIGATNNFGVIGERHPDSKPNGLGRWPPNLALSHLPECERVGTRRVKGSSHPQKPLDTGDTAGFGGGIKNGSAYGDEGGAETVERWACAPGCPVAELDRQSGESGGGERRAARPGAQPFNTERGWNQHSMTRDGATAPENYGDTGGASRFFYVAKSSRAERNAGLDGFEERFSPTMNDGIGGKEHSRPCGCDTFTEWVNEGQSPSTPADSATPPPRATTERISEDGSDSSTIGSGSRSTDPSPRATTSTTETGPSRTTESKTSNSSTPLPISASTHRTTGSAPDDGSANAPCAESGSPQTASISISTETAGSSTDGADPATSQSSSDPSSSVSQRR